MKKVIAVNYGDEKYIAEVVYDEDIESYFGQIININHIVTFYGASEKELEEEFLTSIKVYIDVCRENGIELSTPDKALE